MSRVESRLWLCVQVGSAPSQFHASTAVTSLALTWQEPSWVSMINYARTVILQIPYLLDEVLVLVKGAPYGTIALQLKSFNDPVRLWSMSGRP